MDYTIKRLFILYVLILCFGGMRILAEDEHNHSTSTSSVSTTTSTTTTTTTTTVTTTTTTAETRTETTSSPSPTNQVQDNGNTNNENGNHPHPPLDENGNPLPPPKDGKGNPMGPPLDQNGNPLPPPKDEDGNVIPPQFDENGNRIPPPNSNLSSQGNKDLKMYLIIFSGVICAILLVLILYIFKYKRSINGKIKRLEHVKDMQSLEASNHVPLTTVSPGGFIEDKRDVYSQDSSLKRTPIFNESLSMKSSHSNASGFDDALLYHSELDYNSGPNYITPSQVLINKSLGVKYSKPSIEQINAGYESPYHSPLNGYISKNELDGLYGRNINPYESDEEVVISPIRPRSMVYDTGAGISTVHSTPNIYNTPSSVKTLIPNQNSLNRIRAYNASVPNLTKVGYETDMSYSNNYSSGMKYNIPPVSPMTPLSPKISLSPKSPKSVKSVVSSGYTPQVRVESRNKRRSHSIDITKSKRASYVESMGKRSPNLYSPTYGSPVISNRRNSAISENRSAKSVLIDQMVQAMDMEADSDDDTLSNYPLSDGIEFSAKSKSSPLKAKIITIPKETSSTNIIKSTNPYQKAKVTNVSSSSSSSLQKNNSQITDSSRTISNSQEIDEVKIRISDEDTNESSGIEIPHHHKKYKKDVPGKNVLNRDFLNNKISSTNDYESDSCYESNNSFNQSIYDEVRVFEVEEDDDLLNR